MRETNAAACMTNDIKQNAIRLVAISNTEAAP